METTERTVVYASTAAGSLSGSAVSWAAIFAGAVAASALALILFVLGTGLGLTSVSPWAREGLEAETFGMVAIAWIVFTSMASSALGGYLAGRLRVKWTDVALDEVYFRDTAHGFLSWALAALLTATLTASAMTALVSGGARAGAAVAGGIGDAVGGAVSGAAAVASTADEGGTLDYYVDKLFRRDQAAAPQPAPATPVAPTPPQGQQDAAQAGADGAPATPPAPAPTPAPAAPAAQPEMPALDEVSRVVSRAYRDGELAQEDLTYLGRLVARHTGISQQDAEMRVRQAYDQLGAELREMEQSAREAADTARAVSVQVSLWSFVALLAGAFAGSLAATWGGRQRDL